MRILTAAQMREADRRTIAEGHATGLQLMEAAGRAVAECALKLYPQAQNYVAICGKGNNGGDGLVAARVLSGKGKDVRVLLCAHADDLSPDTAAMLERLWAESSANIVNVSEASMIELEDADVILDALLGIGAKPPVQGFYRTVINAINHQGKPVLSVDLPSGADADAKSDGPCVNASAIVTFTAPKPWHVWSPHSDVPTAVAEIGTPSTVVDEIARGAHPLLFTAADLLPNFFQRPADSNKGKYGHVLVVAGSLGKSGAPAMCALAALRSGAGLATVACPGSTLPTVAAYAPELMTEPLDGRDADYLSERALDAVLKLAAHKSVLAVGPGLGRAPETEAFLQALLSEVELPLVLDADGLNAFDTNPELLKRHRSKFLVLTPHPGEMARLVGKSVKDVQADRLGIAASFAREHCCTVVLKGWRTVIASPDGQIRINPTGNPAMSKGGTGDALTGMIAALIAQYPDYPQNAVLTAVYLHGLAGDVALPEFGLHGMLATDLISAIPRAFQVMQRQQDGNITWLRQVAAA